MKVLRGIAGGVLLAVCAVVIGGPWAEPTAAQSPPAGTRAGRAPRLVSVQASDAREYTASFGELTGGGALSLRGATPSATLYLPIPEDWESAEGSVSLLISHSATLAPDSTLTLKVNGTPLSSIRLTAANVENATWSVRLPAAALTGESVALTVDATTAVTENVCRDLEDAANWVTVSRDSRLQLVGQAKAFEPNLARFPYPFVRTRTPRADATLIVLPDVISGEDVAALAPLAGYFGQKANWRAFDLYAVRERDLTAEMFFGYNLVFAGRAADLRWLASNAATLPLRFADGGRFLDPSGAEVDADTGVMLEMRAPLSMTRAILVLTGGSSEGLRRAVEAVTHPSFPSVARGAYALATGAGRGEAAASPAFNPTISLASLGLPDQVLTGPGKQTADVTFELPARESIEDATLTIVMSHAPLPSGGRSYANVMLNDVPLKGVYLTPENEARTSVRVDVPGDALRSGRNTLRFLVDHRLPTPEVCTRQESEQAWTVINAGTALTLAVSQHEASAPPTLERFSARLAEGALVVVPRSPGPNELAALFLLMTRIGRDLGERAAAVSVVSSDAVDADVLKGRHIIVIGAEADQPLLKDAASALPYRISAASRSIQGKGGSLQIASGGAVGVAEVAVSPWNRERMLLAVTGSTDESVGWAAALLADDTNRNQLKGTIAVIDASGTLTTADTRGPLEVPLARRTETRATPAWMGRGLITLLALVILALGVVIARRMLHQWPT